jgi:initiation factor 1A
MVKNTTGGSGHKKRASKNAKAPVSTRVREPKEEGEILAKVTKLFGNSMAEVLCEDKVVRLLIIRKRFKGRNKRDNNIAVNVLVLVGRRTWEVVRAKKQQKVDLLYVYSKDQIAQLRQKVNIDNIILPDDVEANDEGPYDISNKNDWKNEKVVIGAKQTTVEPEFDFDDI